MRWLLFSIGFVLFDAPREAAEFVQCVFEAAVCAVQVDAVDHGSRLPPAPSGPAGNGRHHLQISQQSGHGGLGLRLLFGDRAASLEKEGRLFENARSHAWRTVAPGAIEFACFTARELVCGECTGHLFALLEIGARHRDEELHGHVRGDLAFAHFLLDPVG